MTSPEAHSPREVTAWIGRVLRRQRGLLDALHAADLDARAKRREANKAEARAFLQAEGSIPVKKYATDLDPVVDRARGEADVAEALVAHLKREIALCQDEKGGAQTAAATMRAELSVLGLTDEGA